jgi:hypothetical protein
MLNVFKREAGTGYRVSFSFTLSGVENDHILMIITIKQMSSSAEFNHFFMPGKNKNV